MPDLTDHALTSGTIPDALGAGGGDDLVSMLAAHPFSAGLDVAHLSLVAAMTSLQEVRAQRFLLRHAQPAETLFLLLSGDVALEIAPCAGDPLILQTLHGGDVLGWSWLFPPHRGHFDARAITPVRSLAIEARPLRELMTADVGLGRDVAMRIGAVLADRLSHARNQLASVRMP